MKKLDFFQSQKSWIRLMNFYVKTIKSITLKRTMFYENIESNCASDCLLKVHFLHVFKNETFIGICSHRLLNSLTSPFRHAKPKKQSKAHCTHLSSASHQALKPVNSLLTGRNKWKCSFSDKKPSQANGNRAATAASQDQPTTDKLEPIPISSILHCH